MAVKDRTSRGFEKARGIELRYASKLRRLAGMIGEIIKGYGNPLEDPSADPQIQTAMAQLSNTITPWAQSVAGRVIAEIDVADAKAWNAHSRHLSRALRQEIASAPTGEMQRLMLAEQVELIRSLPTEAAQRVHRLTLEGMVNGTRANEIADMIQASGSVTRSRATLIARTEVARTASSLTMARSLHVGLEQYVWRTARDSAVRPAHAQMEGKVVNWNDPPHLSDGTTTHAGMIYNCFPGSTKVSLTNGCHHLWRHWYEGALVTIEFEGGCVELTPNHPVLTRRGWVAAEEVNTSDYLIKSRSESLLSVKDDKDQGHPTFDDLFATLDSVVGRERHVGLLFDFHGERPNDDVDAIRADHLLPGHGMSKLFQGVCNFSFAGTYGAVENAGVMGSHFHVGEPLFASGGNEGLPLIGREIIHSDDICLRSATPNYPISFEHISHREGSAPVLEGEGERASASAVFLDDLAFRKVAASVWRRSSALLNFDSTSAEALADDIRVNANLPTGVREGQSGDYEEMRVINNSVGEFSGHVYTMQTINGWFTVTPTGVVVKNCRCYAEPVIHNF